MDRSLKQSGWWHALWMASRCAGKLTPAGFYLIVLTSALEGWKDQELAASGE